MTQITVEETQLKSVVLNVLNDLFNIGDIEEAKRTPVGRLIGLETKVEGLAIEMRHLEQSLRNEMISSEKRVTERMDSLEKRVTARMDSLEKRLAMQERLLFLILAALIGGLIKLILFP